MSSEKPPQGLTIQNILSDLPHVVEARRAKLEHLETKEDIEQFAAIYANQSKRLDDIIDWKKDGNLFGLIGEYPLTYEPIANLDRSAKSLFNYIAYDNKKIVRDGRNIFTKRRKTPNSVYVKQVVGGYYIPDKKGVDIEFEEYYQLRWAKIYVHLDAVNNLPDDSDERMQMLDYLKEKHRDFYDALTVSDDSEPPSPSKKQNSPSRSSKSSRSVTNSPSRSSKSSRSVTNSPSRSPKSSRSVTNSPSRSSKSSRSVTNSPSRSSKSSRSVTNSPSRSSKSSRSVTNSPSRASNSSRTKQNSASKVPNSNKNSSESTRKSNPTKRMPAKKVPASKGNSTIAPSSSTSSELNQELQQQTDEASSSSSSQSFLPPIGSIIGQLEKSESVKALEAIVDERECTTTVSDGNSRTSKKRVAKEKRRKNLEPMEDQVDNDEIERILAEKAKRFDYKPKFDKKVNESLKKELAKYPALALTVFHYEDKNDIDKVEDTERSKPLFLVIMVHFINQTKHLPSSDYKVENLLLSFEQVNSKESKVTLTVFERTFFQYGLDTKYLVVVSELSLNLRSSLKSRFRNCCYLQCNWEIMVNHILNGEGTSDSKPLLDNLIQSSDDNDNKTQPNVDAFKQKSKQLLEWIASAEKMNDFLEKSNKTTKVLHFDLTANHLLTVWIILKKHLQEQESTDSWSVKLNETILANIRRLNPIYRVACFLNPFDLSEWMSAGDHQFCEKDQNDIEIEFTLFEMYLPALDEGKTQTATDDETNDDDSSLEPQIKRRKRLRDEIERIKRERESISPKVKEIKTIKQEMLDYIDLVKKNPDWADFCQFTFWESGCFSFPLLKRAAQFFLSIPATIQPSVRLLKDSVKQVEGNIEEYSAQVKLSRIINNEYLMDDDEDDDNANKNENEDENRQSDNVSADAEQINNEDNPDQGMNQVEIANQTSV